MCASFKFTQEYQDLLLVCLVRHGGEFAYVTAELKANYFTGVQATIVARCLLKYHEEYNRFPGWPVVRELVTRETAKIPDRDLDTSQEYITRLSETDTSDWEHVRDNVVGFLRERAYVVALHQAVQYMQEDKVPDGGLAPLFEAAAQVGQNVDDLGFIFHQDVDRVVKQVTAASYGIATGYPLLDKIWRNGWGPGWLIVPLAPPKRYKTATCINLACNMVSPQIGVDVLYYAAEISQELAMCRAMCNIARLSMDYMYDTPEKFAAGVKSAMQGAVAGNLLFKSFASKSASMLDIRNHAKMAVKQLGIKPKAIVIDYAETVKAEGSKDEPEYRKSASVYTAARALGAEIGAAVIMPDRCNKETTDKPVPSMTSFQGSFEKAGIVDVSFGLCATDEEYRANVLRLFVFLNRHGRAYQHLRGRVDPESWRIEMTEEVPYDGEEEAKESRGGKGGRGGPQRRRELPPELADGA